MLDDNAKMHAMKAIMDYADDAENDGMKSMAAPRRESQGGLSDPNFMKKSAKGAENEPAASGASGKVDTDQERDAEGMADEEENDNPIKGLLSMFGR